MGCSASTQTHIQSSKDFCVPFPGAEMDRQMSEKQPEGEDGSQLDEGFSELHTKDMSKAHQILVGCSFSNIPTKQLSKPCGDCRLPKSTPKGAYKRLVERSHHHRDSGIDDADITLHNLHVSRYVFIKLLLI
jgi:hypothetical protein